MTTTPQAPDTLREAVQLWKAAGRDPQPPSRWSPAVWQRRFPEQADYLSALPRPISRSDVTTQCANALEGPDQATQAFIAAMIWGYGPVGYGAFRTKRVLTANDGVGDTLAEVARIATNEGGTTAFAWLANPHHRLRYLGVTFATKYLFFCAANGNGRPALVLDRLVRGWMSTNLDWRLSLNWDVDGYGEYVDTLCTWAVELDIEPGNLEMLVFQLAANADPRSLWSAAELFASTPSETTTPAGEISDDATGLIDLLDDAASTFAALLDITEPDDITDFDRGVRDLKRIILARR